MAAGTGAVPPFPIPIFATEAWIAAVTAVGGLCQCAGQCGRKHTATGGRRDREQGRNGVTLHLTGLGAVYCPRCHDGVARAEARNAPAPVVDQLDILALFG